MTYRQLLNIIQKKLEATDIPEAAADAWRLFEGIWGFRRSDMFLHGDEEIIDEAKITLLMEQTELRMKRIPIQYITGEQEFCGLTFKVSRDTLIPRFDTELLAEKVASVCTGKSLLDMCTGTGCILIAATKLGKPKLSVGCDLSLGACRLAKENAALNDCSIEVFQGNLFEALKDTGYENTEFDIIVSNPPYIKTKEIEKLLPEVRDNEPMSALDGFEDGLWFYREITGESIKHLANEGMLLYEIGFDQAQEVTEIMESYGFTEIEVTKDYAGLDRIVTGRIKKHV